MTTMYFKTLRVAEDGGLNYQKNMLPFNQLIQGAIRHFQLVFVKIINV